MIDTEQINIGPHTTGHHLDPPSSGRGSRGNMSPGRHRDQNCPSPCLQFPARIPGAELFSLPEHGDRKADPTLQSSRVRPGFGRNRDGYAWLPAGITSAACSAAAWHLFQPPGLPGLQFGAMPVLSPVVDMGALIQIHVSWSSVTPDQLKKSRRVLLRRQMLYWDYYAREGPSHRPLGAATPHLWRGEQDNLVTGIVNGSRCVFPAAWRLCRANTSS